MLGMAACVYNPCVYNPRRDRQMLGMAACVYNPSTETDRQMLGLDGQPVLSSSELQANTHTHTQVREER